MVFQVSALTSLRHHLAPSSPTPTSPLPFALISGMFINANNKVNFNQSSWRQQKWRKEQREHQQAAREQVTHTRTYTRIHTHTHTGTRSPASQVCATKLSQNNIAYFLALKKGRLPQLASLLSLPPSLPVVGVKRFKRELQPRPRRPRLAAVECD